MVSPSDRHNALATEFVMKAGRECKTPAELMVVLESTILATMIMLVKQHGMKPGHASHYIEEAVQNATERFAAIEKDSN